MNWTFSRSTVLLHRRAPSIPQTGHFPIAIILSISGIAFVGDLGRQKQRLCQTFAQRLRPVH